MLRRFRGVRFGTATRKHRGAETPVVVLIIIMSLDHEVNDNGDNGNKGKRGRGKGKENKENVVQSV